MKKTFAIGMGGAAGQGVATPGDVFAKIFSRRGLRSNAYNADQSIIRGAAHISHDPDWRGERHQHPIVWIC